jgi:hypothetical protein
MRRLTLLATLAAAACGPAAPSSPAPQVAASAETRIIAGKNQTDQSMLINADPQVVRTTLAVPAADVFAALPGAFADLGIPVTQTDSAALVMQNARFVASRRLAGEPMTALFDCGRSGMGDALADTYRLRIGIRTVVVPEGSSSRVETLVGASGQSPDGRSNDPVVCNSTGRLEQLMNRAIQLNLAK